MEIVLKLSPKDATECELAEVSVDYIAFIKGLDGNLDDLSDAFILTCLEQHYNLPTNYLADYKVLRRSVVIQVSK